MGGDLSVSIGDRDGQLVAQGKDIPAQLGAMPFSFELLLEPSARRSTPSRAAYFFHLPTERLVEYVAAAGACPPKPRAEDGDGTR
jgi:hypothetical protein